jgi:hypothetical protein
LLIRSQNHIVPRQIQYAGSSRFKNDIVLDAGKSAGCRNTHSLGGIFLLEKCKKSGIYRAKEGVWCVCVAVPWHPEQYVFPEASTLDLALFSSIVSCAYYLQVYCDARWRLEAYSCKHKMPTWRLENVLCKYHSIIIRRLARWSESGGMRDKFDPIPQPNIATIN